MLLSLGRGAYENGVVTKLPGGAWHGATADFNRDGKPDLAVNTPTGIAILLGTGRALAPFTAGATITLANTGPLLTGDLNNDGKADLVVTTPTALVTYLGNGDGTFTQASSMPASLGGSIALADFNHDGKLDVADSGNLLALGNGDGTFQAPVPIVASVPQGGFSNVAAGDINNDGWPDLVMVSANLIPVNMYVLLNDQNGGFNQVPSSGGSETRQVMLADMDGDGNLDVIISSISGASAGVYLGDGQGGFTYHVGAANAVSFPGGTNMVADLNGDGILDIMVQGANTLAIFLGKGGAAYAEPFYLGTGPSPGSILTANLHGQKPWKHLPDIVLPDLSGGIRVLLNTTQ